MATQNNIAFTRNILIIPEHLYEITPFIHNFCGIIVENDHLIKNFKCESDTILYICGDIDKLLSQININNTMYIIEEISYNYTQGNTCTLGQVPINIHNLGVCYYKLFDGNDFFGKIKESHKFQVLTESNKPSVAYRKGIYLSDVTVDGTYNLLRCSTNFEGATDNFRDIDRQIITKINQVVSEMFEQPVVMNHVLAQIYENNPDTQKKAVIKAHSDKTKDMPANGLIVFTTFYDSIEQYKTKNMFDLYYGKKEISVLTKLQFKRKNDDDTIPKEFSVTLCPNSVFIIPLSTNRLYTHEIRSSILPVGKIPTRLGYVIRCSNVKARYDDDKTYIINSDSDTLLRDADDTDVTKLKELYRQENTSTDRVNYPYIDFSINKGDYEKPIY